MSDIRIFTDGAARGNPGLSAAGVVIFDGDKMLTEVRAFLGEQTNNWAEYEAVIIALHKAYELGLHKKTISFYLDSKLVVEQLSGNWKIKTPSIKSQYDKVQSVLQKGFTRVTYTHIPREKNSYADQLANEAIDNRS